MTLTTNGTLLGENLNELLLCGLDGVNVSLDTLKADVYRRITGSDWLDTVLESIERSVRAGLRVKINCVLEDGVNSEEWEALANLSRDRKLDVRFIEMMPIGPGKNREAVRSGRLLGILREKYPGVEREISVHGNGPAVYYRIPGFTGSVGFISVVRGKFCGSCNRDRMTAKGELKPCLCYSDSVDLRAVLRNGGNIEEIKKDTGGRPAKTGDALL